MAPAVWWQRLCWRGKALLVAYALGGVPSVAQRSLDIELVPLTTANVCGDRQVVVTINPNAPLSVNDSLLLFEFAIRYDPQKLQFIAPLFIGTIAENADYQGSGAIDSATIRIWAFNVLRPLRGDGPLCGMLFRYRSECADTTSIAFAREPEKNPEAKITYGRLGRALIEAVESPGINRSLTAQFPHGLIQCQTNQAQTIQWYFSIAPGTRLRQWQWYLVARGPLQIEHVALAEEDSLQLELESISPTMVRAQISSPSPIAPRRIPLECSVVLRSTDTATLWVEMLPPLCACVGTVQSDTVTVVSAPLGGVNAEKENVIYWHWNGSWWELCGSDAQLAELTIWDHVGRCLYHGAPATEYIATLQQLVPWMAVRLRYRDGSQHQTILMHGAMVANNQK